MYYRNLWVSLPCCISGFLNGATFPEPCGSFRTSSHLDYCVGGSWLQALRPEPGMSGRSFPPPNTALDPQVAHSRGFSGRKVAPSLFASWLGIRTRNTKNFVIFFPSILYTAFWGASGRTRQLCVERIKGARDKDVSKLTVLIHSSNVQRQGVVNSIVNLALERQR